jgi:hypothetical protein
MPAAQCFRTAYPNFKGKPASATRQASKLLAHPMISSMIAQHRQRVADRSSMTAEDIIRRWTAIADTDRNQLVEIRRHCCRFCHGQHHQWQFTPNEMREAREAYDRLVRETKEAGVDWDEFDQKGGIGYDRRKDPHPECPECFGEGVVTVFLKDTRKLPPEAMALFEGVKVTKEGIEIKISERGKALENLAQNLGLLDRVQRNINLNANMDVPVDKIPDDPVEASRFYQKLMG